MSLTQIQHGCKINYSLRVGQRLANGYHNIESIFLPLANPFDRLAFRLSQKRGDIRVRMNPTGSSVESIRNLSPDDNTIVRAYRLYADRTGFRPELDVLVDKSIPPGAGLGGGSANAAATLSFLQQQAAEAGVQPLSEQELHDAAGSLGADVPFFLRNSAAHVTGIGDKITPMENPAAGLFLLLVCPDIAVSTAWAYAELDILRERNSLSPPIGQKDCKNTPIECLTTEMHRANYSSPAGLLEHGNDFEAVVFVRYPDIARLKRRLYDLGAETAHLSGTGSSMFSLFQDAAKALAAERSLANQGLQVYGQKM